MLSNFVLQIIVAEKVIFFLSLAAAALLATRFRRPLSFLILITAAVTAFYAVLSFHLQRMWWGNNGDEVFVGAALTNIIHGGFWHDFYYSWLPPFYPPLYFWKIGLLARLLHIKAISAAKVGVTLTLGAWFLLPYLLNAAYWKWIAAKGEGEGVTRAVWFWALPAILFFLLLDFDAIILKPYETLPALLCALWIGWFAQSVFANHWPGKKILWFGVTGGILFLWFYFWWFILIPAMVVLALASNKRVNALKNIIFIGAIMALVSAPYWLPLLLSIVKYGLESWQSRYFVPQDLSTFGPWAEFSVRGFLALTGLAGALFWWRTPLMKGVGVTLLVAFGYQVANTVALLFGHRPAQMAKPFLFLGTALLVISCSYAIVWVFEEIQKRKPQLLQPSILLFIVVLLPLSPFVKFIDDPVVHQQLDKDLVRPAAAGLADKLRVAVPDYQNRIWLASGDPELNLYLPLTYYIAYNPNFSHPASQYSRRFALAQAITQANSAEDVDRLLTSAAPPITGLLLYKDPVTSTYPLFFWQDNYPNGGKELRLDLKPALVDSNTWKLILHDGNWFAYVRP